VLATGVGRIRWAASHLVIALAGGAVLLLLAGLTAGLSYAGQQRDLGQVWPVLAGALVQLPAVWVLTGCAVAAFGLAPQASVAGWVALVAVLVVGEFGSILGLDHWVLDISPFTHLPRLPGGTAHPAPIAWVLALALALLAASLAGWRRRDVTT